MDNGLMEVREKSGYFTGLLNDEEFEHYWPHIEKMMDFVPHTWEDLTKDGVVERVLNHNLQVWIVGGADVEMVLFTQIATFETGKVLQIFWGAGIGEVYEKAGDAVDAAMEYFAKTQNCKRIDVIGRFGWERILAKRGFKRKAIILSRPVVRGDLQ